MRTLLNVLLLVLILFSLQIYADRLIEETKGEHSNYGNFRKLVQQVRAEREALAKDSGTPRVVHPKQTVNDDIYFFFGVSDLDHNGHLDGHELRVAFLRQLDQAARQRVTLPELEERIDHTLDEDDRDGDGLISWAEYLESQLYHAQNRNQKQDLLQQQQH